ncbi:MAG: Tfp pilus assembly protein FimT/FimU [Candidatus Saccharimonadales bacterium]
MKGEKTPAGYTILEIMIVLAVSGVMFLIAANFINGKQEKTQFPGAVNSLATIVQKTIKDVVNGKYADINLKCTISAGSPPTVSVTQSSTYTTTNNPANDLQGSNNGCIFLGKVMQFQEKVPNQDPPSEYAVYPIAAAQLNSKGVPIGADGANPTTPYDLAGPTPIDVLSTDNVTPYHLNIVNMGLEDVANEPGAGQAFKTPINTFYAIGLLQNLGTTNTPTLNGAQPVALYYINSITAVQTRATAESFISGTTINPVPLGKEIVMCVSDGTQYAYIELGSAASQLQVNVKILGVTPCT